MKLPIGHIDRGIELLLSERGGKHCGLWPMVFYIYICVWINIYREVSPFFCVFLARVKFSPFLPMSDVFFVMLFRTFSFVVFGEERWEGLHAGLTSFDKYFGSFVAARMFNIYPCLSVEQLWYEWFSQ